MQALITFIDANKGKISLIATFLAAGAAALGYPVPDWVIGVLAAQGISTTVRLVAGNGVSK